MTSAPLVVRTDKAEATSELGETIAAVLRPGDVVALSGDLGAGKTCFVQGAAQGLGVTDRVTSPTFMLVKTYRGRLPVVHVDVYRLDRLQDVLDLGDEVFAPDVVTFVEWGDAIRALLPDDRLDVELTHTDGDSTAREVVLRPHGGAWDGRRSRLAAACAPWAA